MKKRNKVFIASSIDGYIADRAGGIDWLQSVPNPDHDDMGYNSFIKEVDALVMGRNTFETVCGFDIEWPYTKPVYVLSRRLKSVAAKFQDKAELVHGDLREVLECIHAKGHGQLYVDGGGTIQSFLKEGLIDDLILTTIPIVLGGGIPLFSEMDTPLEFDLIETKVYLDQIVQRHYKRKNRN
ncbi:dihydrofolate reductase family protein [Lutimonas zeaxanthinifaciens]|uniref:dihydrofolate reductase family protein n=1 Tax=Lutimonas zeaxanthinifaciens TaxID=3060215 RepID=UPI00265D45B5|nr:dihydrofolate reductase family protein [Lutimonas sp. YSD2104]WKK67169.1 dihydrofolate reductase family protein [Lutimonas sp. YSD2104]